MTRQSEWKLVYSSDREALHIDETGVYAPELTIVEDLGESAEELEDKFLIYRFPLQRCEYDDLNDVLSDNPWFPYIPAWFATIDRWGNKLQLAARSAGLRTEDLITLLCSEEPTSLAAGYALLVGYYGASEFDPYGEEFRSEEDVFVALS